MIGKTIEDMWLEAGYYLALQFDNGWHVVRMLGRERTSLKNYNLKYNSTTTTHATGTTTADWDEPTDSQNRKYLEPEDNHKDQLYQIFWGGSPVSADIRFFTQFISRQDRGSLTGTRAVPGDVGFIDSEVSPYNNPSVQTKLFTIYDRSPVFKAYNATLNTQTIHMNFHVMKYLYEVIKDKNLIKELLAPGQRRCEKYTMGGIDRMITPPEWWSQKFSGVPKTFEELGL